MGENQYSSLDVLPLRFAHCYYKKQHAPLLRKNIEGSNMKRIGPGISNRILVGSPVYKLECPSLVLFGSPTLFGCGVFR
jgi:hypothetical protein